MNTFQVENLCRSDEVLSPKFAGVFALDTLPTSIENDKFYVCNTEPSNLEGEHWVAMYSNGNQKEYFDSLGGSVDEKRFLDFFGGEYIYVTVQTQEPFSSVCGQYCIFYMLLRARGYSLNTIMNMLDVYDDDSDIFVTNIIKLFYGVEY